MSKDEQIKRIMLGLKCSYDEAVEIYEDEKKVDKMTMTELKNETGEEILKVMNEMTRTGTRKTATKTTRTRKENTTKSAIISEIAKFLEENGYEAVNITNKERQIAFKVGENDYEFTLVQKRKPKN